MNVLKPNQKNTVITLSSSGVSQREIAQKTGIDRKTIRKYARAAALIRTAEKDSNSPGVATGSDGGENQNPPSWPPALAAPTAATAIMMPAPARSACESHREWIEAQVRLKRNAMAIYQELVDRRGFTNRYNSVKRFVRGLKQVTPLVFDRLAFGPGEEAQVDYGEGALTLHPTTGQFRKPRLFVMTLRYSRRSFRKVVWKSSQQTWAQLHEEAFRYFCGCPQYVVLDNLKEGVVTPDLYEPEINRVYASMLSHYGVVADPARVRDPDRKGTVESAIQHTQGTCLKGLRFESLEEQNAHLMHWEEKWAALRIHGREKRQVEEMFREEKPHLKVLPLVPFRYFTEGTRTVQDDTTVQVDSSWYAARPAPIGSEVLVRIFDGIIEIRDVKTLALIRRHPRALRKGKVELPDEERIFNPSRQTQVIFRQAEAIGPKAAALCRDLFEHRGREGQKSMWGIVGLARRYPARIVERAAEQAVACGVSSFKSVRANCERFFSEALATLDGAPHSEHVRPANLTQHHELIREPTEYAAFFAASINQTQNI